MVDSVNMALARADDVYKVYDYLLGKTSGREAAAELTAITFHSLSMQFGTSFISKAIEGLSETLAAVAPGGEADQSVLKGVGQEIGEGLGKVAQALSELPKQIDDIAQRAEQRSRVAP